MLRNASSQGCRTTVLKVPRHVKEEPAEMTGRIEGTDGSFPDVCSFCCPIELDRKRGQPDPSDFLYNRAHAAARSMLEGSLPYYAARCRLAGKSSPCAVQPDPCFSHFSSTHCSRGGDE